MITGAMFFNFLNLLWVLLVVGVLLGVVTAFLMAIVLLRPARMTDGRAAWRLRRLSPGDLHLHYADVTFDVLDETDGGRLKLTAWWIPLLGGASTGRCVVMLHGYGDAKVGAIAWAPTFHALGYHILALDLRAHGESEGRYCTAGFFERHDVSQVVDQLRRDRPKDTRQIVLFGVSLGAAVAAATAVLRDDIAAVVMECPYPDYELAAASHAEVLGAPGRLLQGYAFQWAQKIARVDFGAVKPVDLIPRVACPLMVIRSEIDVFIDDDHAAMVEAAVRRRPAEWITEYWNAESAHHVEALQADPVLYARKIGAFLEAALGEPASKSASSQTLLK